MRWRRDARIQSEDERGKMKGAAVEGTEGRARQRRTEGTDTAAVKQRALLEPVNRCNIS